MAATVAPTVEYFDQFIRASPVLYTVFDRVDLANVKGFGLVLQGRTPMCV